MSRTDVSGGVPPDEQPTDAVLAVVGDLLADVVGAEVLAEIPLGRSTRFDADLELESIEFVALADRIQEHFGARIDVVSWIGAMDLEAIIDLSVGDLVDFIVACGG